VVSGGVAGTAGAGRVKRWEVGGGKPEGGEESLRVGSLKGFEVPDVELVVVV